MKKSIKISLAVVVILAITIYTQITIFVVPPIGLLPTGKTVIITRFDKTAFIDSPDAMCERLQDGVSLFCRGMMMGSVIKNSKILLRLPYSPWLYSISTGGKTYNR